MFPRFAVSNPTSSAEHTAPRSEALNLAGGQTLTVNIEFVPPPPGYVTAYKKILGRYWNEYPPKDFLDAKKGLNEAQIKAQVHVWRLRMATKGEDEVACSFTNKRAKAWAFPDYVEADVKNKIRILFENFTLEDHRYYPFWDLKHKNFDLNWDDTLRFLGRWCSNEYLVAKAEADARALEADARALEAVGASAGASPALASLTPPPLVLTPPEFREITNPGALAPSLEGDAVLAVGTSPTLASLTAAAAGSPAQAAGTSPPQAILTPPPINLGGQWTGFAERVEGEPATPSLL